MKSKGILIALLLLLPICAAFSQCGTVTPNGNQTDYGSGQWYGYVYDGINNFTAYQGYITQSATFDYSFNGDNTPFTTTGGCSVDPNTFTVRFKMQLNIPCGTYQFTSGGDDGYRLSIDGGSTYLINNFADHSYAATTSAAVFINTATTYLVLDYYENTGTNRVSFTYTKISNGDGGTIGSNQSICFATTGDPAAFTSTAAALFCTGNALTYQWQSSPDNSLWSNIASANAATFDPPAGFTAGTVYYRRRATDNGNSDIVYSNTVSVIDRRSKAIKLPMAAVLLHGLAISMMASIHILPLLIRATSPNPQLLTLTKVLPVQHVPSARMVVISTPTPLQQDLKAGKPLLAAIISLLSVPMMVCASASMVAVHT